MASRPFKATRPTDGQRAFLWTEKRSSAKYDGSVLDPEFDADEVEHDPYERMVFFDGELAVDEKRMGLGRARDARRKRRTVDTEHHDVKLQDEPPPGWAEP